jgi:hypothetical protein
MKHCWLDGYRTKLFLYVITASLTALLADLQHYVCHGSGVFHINPFQTIIVVINFILQGLIAWRAFIDDSSEKRNKEVEVPTLLVDNHNINHH